MEKVFTVIGATVVVLLLVVGLSLLMAWPVMAIINYLFAPQALIWLFGSAHVTFWKSFFLGLLCGILFKSTSSSNK